MYEASDLRKGLKIEMEGVPYLVSEFNFVKPGKGQAMYVCRLKNLLSGGTVSKTFRSADKIDKPNLEERKLTFSYANGDAYVFIDDNYEEVTISAEALGNNRFLLSEEMLVQVLFHNGRPLEIVLPTWVEKEITDTEPGYRGDTATNVTKPAKIAGGYEIKVPLFVNKGDMVRIDTRTGEYAERVR